jgi:hypothetical protein
MSVKIGLNEDGSLDEVFGSGEDVHLEQMDKDHWYLGIGKVQIWFHSKKKIKANFEDSRDAGEAYTTPKTRMNHMNMELVEILRDIEDDCLTANRLDKANAMALAISIIQSQAGIPDQKSLDSGACVNVVSTNQTAIPITESEFISSLAKRVLESGGRI